MATDLIASHVDAPELFAAVQSTFSDLFEIERLVAASSERALFVVRDSILKRQVSVRVHLKPDATSRTWFLRETETLAALDHHVLRPIFQAGFRDQWAYRTSRWIEGESLLDAVARGPRPIPSVLGLVHDLTSVFGYIHSHQIVVRRIIPAAVMLESTGRTFVIDLRWASVLLDVAPALDAESEPFLAPEVRAGEVGNPSSDMYTAGALLYYAVTAQPPPADPTHVIPPRELRPACPQALERIITRALQADGSQRYLTAVEMREDLLADLGDFEVQIPVAPPLRSHEDSRAWEQRLRRALGADYELVDELGAGEFGRVYKVRDLELERDVALKVLHPFLTTDQGVVERFRREAQLAGRMMHPHIVNTYDIGGRTGLLWYTMEYVDGQNLAQLVAEHGPQEIARVTRLMHEALGALQFAHGHGLVHRDLKPENLLLDATGAVHVADFGLAIAFVGSEGFGGATSRSGTPEFAAPEQLLGEHVDHRVDLYSLTLCAYFALAGQSPFGGGSVESVIARQTVSGVPDLRAVRSDLPPRFLDMLARGAARDPEQRFQSAAEYASALDTAELPIRKRSFPWLSAP